MKKQIIAISTVVLLGTGGAALANDHKASICHNGSTYNAETQLEDPISFVITIAGKQHAKAVDKHVENHGDLEDAFLVGDPGAGEECELQLDGIEVVCEPVTLCETDEADDVI
jgi:hypothetical protein